MENQNSSKYRAKRPFSQVDTEEDEAVPISKRINHLNIKGPRTSSDQDDQPHVPQPEIGAVGGAMNPQAQAQPMRVPLMAAPLDSPSFQAMDPTFQAQLWGCAGRPPVAMPHHHNHHTSNLINHNMQPASPPMINGGHCTASPGPGLGNASMFYHMPPVAAYPSMAQAAMQQHPSPGPNGLAQHGLQYQHSASPGNDRHENLYDEDVVMMDDEVYDPELGETENPHYFQINHVLFQAQCRRARRNGYTLNSGPPLE